RKTLNCLRLNSKELTMTVLSSVRRRPVILVNVNRCGARTVSSDIGYSPPSWLVTETGVRAQRRGESAGQGAGHPDEYVHHRLGALQRDRDDHIGAGEDGAQDEWHHQVPHAAHATATTALPEVAQDAEHDQRHADHGQNGDELPTRGGADRRPQAIPGADEI